jgi:hypothetical protein
MLRPNGIRGAAALVLAVWAVSAWVTAFHHHGCECCGHHGHEREQEQRQDDEVPCPICTAVEQVPLMAATRTETVERERDVVVLITPWIALVPEDVFFDRPLARGPPAVS